MRYLTFALAKGRLAKKTLAMFEQMGITCEEAKDPDTRKLIFTNEAPYNPGLPAPGAAFAFSAVPP